MPAADGDYLGSAAKVAPPKSFVALFEAQFQALARTHERSAYGDDEDRGIEQALADAAREEPVPVDDVSVGNRLEMALTRTHCRAAGGRAGGQLLEFSNSWETENAAMALAGRDFEPGEISRRRRSERGPQGTGHVELPRSGPQAESSVSLRCVRTTGGPLFKHSAARGC